LYSQSARLFSTNFQAPKKVLKFRVQTALPDGPLIGLQFAVRQFTSILRESSGNFATIFAAQNVCLLQLSV
jgi:hypothetical protein